MKKLTLLLLFCSTIFFACKKEKEKEAEAKTEGLTKIVCVGNTEIGVYKYNAIIWENGIEKKLSEEISYAKSVLIADNNVYVTGHITNTPVYWRNGIINFLPFDEGGFGSADKMTIYNGNQYIVGNNSGRITVWKNGQISKSLYRKDSLYYYRPVMHHDDLYYLAREVKGGVSTYSYYKNEIATQLPKSENCSVDFIGIANNDIYVAGIDKRNSELYIWKNNVKTTFVKIADTNVNRVDLLSIETEGSDAYVFYQLQSSNPSGNTNKYWKNGSEFNLNTEIHFSGYKNKLIDSKIYSCGKNKGAVYFIGDQKHQLNNNTQSEVLDIALIKVK